MPIATDANTLYAHYLAGRYPAAVCATVPAGPEVDQDPVRAHGRAEISVARALGAYDAERGIPAEMALPTAPEICSRVAALMGTPAVTVDGQPLAAGVRLELQTGGHFPVIVATDPSGSIAFADLYVSDDRTTRWQWLVDAMTTGKVGEAPPAPTAPAQPTAPAPAGVVVRIEIDEGGRTHKFCLSAAKLDLHTEELPSDLCRMRLDVTGRLERAAKLPQAAAPAGGAK